MKIKFINYPLAYKQNKKKIDQAILGCLRRGDLILRKDVEEFESNLAEYLGVKYAIGVNSGTDALFFALKALGIKQRDEVITVSHTFIATIQIIIHCGAIPVLIDIGEDALMNVDKLEGAITSNTKAIIPVHLSGKVCDMDRIMKIADKYNLYIIEDAAQALGAKWNGKCAGSIGYIGCFSHYPAKILGCYGDGGSLVTDNPEIADIVRKLRNHWNVNQSGVNIKAPEVMNWGWNSRLDNIQAAVLNVKLKQLPQVLQRRKEIAEMYNEGLKDLPLILPIQQKQQVYQEYIVRSKEREKIADYLQKKGIELLIRDTIPNHLLSGLNLNHFILPITEQMAQDSFRLPVYPEMTNVQVKYIIKSIKEFYGNKRSS